MKVTIWQIKDIGNCDYAFREYRSDKFSLNDYEPVFTRESVESKLIDGEHKDYLNYLERLFELFNRPDLRPDDFVGHSLSVSDVVEIDDTLYYCDDFGWTKIK